MSTIVTFPSVDFTTVSDEETFRRITAEAERLADQSEVERSFFLPKRAVEIGVEEKILKSAITAVLRQRAERVTAEWVEQERERRRQEQQRTTEERKQRDLAKEAAREGEQAKKHGEREQNRIANQAEREKRRAQKEAEQKSREKRKQLADISRMPVACHHKEIERLSGRLGEDVDEIHKEFADFLGVNVEATEPWPDPVGAAAVLQALSAKISKHVVLQPHQLTAAALWTAHTWFYDYDVPIHSPMLAATSAEPDSGKSTLVAVLGLSLIHI